MDEVLQKIGYFFALLITHSAGRLSNTNRCRKEADVQPATEVGLEGSTLYFVC
jgi:hypothetical protein